MTNWIQDWFGSEYYSLLYKHRDCSEAKSFLDNLNSLFHLPFNSKIIDCGCGKGRHSIYLAENGFNVTGIDISEKNINEAIKSAEQNEVLLSSGKKENLTFYVHDTRNLFRINYYDVVLSLFTSFGYFEKDSENNKSVLSLTSALKQGGWFVLDFMNTVKEIKSLIPVETSACNGVSFFVKRFCENDLVVKEIHVEDKEKIFSYSERVKAYKLADLENFFRKNQLEIVHLFGDYHLNKFDENKSERLILIGKKK